MRQSRTVQLIAWIFLPILVVSIAACQKQQVLSSSMQSFQQMSDLEDGSTPFFQLSEENSTQLLIMAATNWHEGLLPY